MKNLDLCKLEIFLSVFYDDYIRAASVDTDISVKYLCILIAQLYKHWINYGKYTADKPNELLFKSTELAAILTENAGP